MPLTHDFLPLMKSLQQDAAGWFYTAEVAGMQLVLRKLHLLHLAGRAVKYQCWSGKSTEILESSCQRELNWASVLGLQLSARDNRTVWMWRPIPNISLPCALRASRYSDPPHFFLQRLPFKQMSNARWELILLQEGILDLILDNSVPSE